MQTPDVETLDRIIRTRGGFGHREHLELAWSYLRRHPIEEAEAVMVGAIRHPDLLDGKLLEHFYSRELIFSESARAVWADPDLRPLPTLA
jgi:hypothetical protein